MTIDQLGMFPVRKSINIINCKKFFYCASAMFNTSFL